MSRPSLGIQKVDSLHFYVRDLQRSVDFYTKKLGFAEIGTSSPEMEAAGNQRSVVLRAGDVSFVFISPIGDGGRAWRWLRKHPEGVGTIVFEVADIEAAFRWLNEREATPIDEIQWFEDEGGRLGTFNITTPFGDTTFRFVQRAGFRGVFPGFQAHATARGGTNAYGIRSIDHITSNFQTMTPALLWMEHVMGFERYWKVAFHTRDVGNGGFGGSGLKSVVMWDPSSGVKFANNEPARPFFKNSQINIFGEDHRGDGVQHAALDVGDIRSTVEGLRAAGVDFMPTPGSYYDMLPDRLKQIGVGQIDEPIDELRRLEILVDGDKEHHYMLQIFLKEGARQFKDPEAGPFFVEIIQRKGDRGFGAGNFRALFESIEREQSGRM